MKLADLENIIAEEIENILNETSLSRVHQHITNNDCAIMSAKEMILLINQSVLIQRVSQLQRKMYLLLN